MKDIRSMTQIVKQKEKKCGQNIIKNNEAINTPFLPPWTSNKNTKKRGENFRFFHQKFERDTPKPSKILQVLDKLEGKSWKEKTSFDKRICKKQV